MRREEYIAANRLAWNAAAPHHARACLEELKRDFARPGHSCLDPVETGVLRELGVAGADVAQLCCNNGRELLSVKNLGAGRCVGFDLSDAFIAQARELTAIAGLDCEFVATDVAEIPADYNASFDLVTFTIGALCWLPDVADAFRVVHRLLRPAGRVFIYELHPALEMFEPGEPAPPLIVRHSYFKAEPFVEEQGLDYYGNTTYDGAPAYSFIRRLGDVFTALLDAGFTIRAFREYGHDISIVFRRIAELEAKPPMCYTLVAQKEPS